MFQKRESCILVDDPLLPVGASKRHAAENNLGNLQPRISKLGVLHLWGRFFGHVQPILVDKWAIVASAEAQYPCFLRR